LSVPNAAAPFLHLQFLSFAASSICNFHLRSFVRRDLEIRRAGITEIAIFHSSKEELLPQHGYPSFAVVADPEKRLYEQYGVASVSQDKAEGSPIPNGGVWALPAEFLVADTGMVKAVHYGKHAADRWSVDELLALARSHTHNPTALRHFRPAEEQEPEWPQ
jgi:peroxiredoxin